MKRIVVVVALSLTASVFAQTSQTPKSTAPALAKQAPRRNPPTLGFNRLKDVPPILDSDAYTEGQKLEKELPSNQFVHD